MHNVVIFPLTLLLLGLLIVISSNITIIIMETETETKMKICMYKDFSHRFVLSSYPGSVTFFPSFFFLFIISFFANELFM